jgi:hypothetical protein
MLLSLAMFISSTLGLMFVVGDLLIMHHWGYTWWAVPLLIGGAACSWFFRAASRTWLEDHRAR